MVHVMNIYWSMHHDFKFCAISQVGISCTFFNVWLRSNFDLKMAGVKAIENWAISPLNNQNKML